MRKYFAALILAMSSYSALGQETPWSTLTLVGEGKLKVLFWDIYQAQLYTESGTYQERQYPLALRLTYLRSFSKEELVSETRNQWQELGFDNIAQQQRWSEILFELWPDVEKNDSITLYIDSHKNSRFYFNQKELGQVTEADFSQSFLAIWLSENTSAPSVRKQLIAGNQND